jgi:hypothetical protein
VVDEPIGAGFQEEESGDESGHIVQYGISCAHFFLAELATMPTSVENRKKRFVSRESREMNSLDARVRNFQDHISVTLASCELEATLYGQSRATPIDLDGRDGPPSPMEVR